MEKKVIGAPNLAGTYTQNFQAETGLDPKANPAELIAYYNARGTHKMAEILVIATNELGNVRQELSELTKEIVYIKQFLASSQKK